MSDLSHDSPGVQGLAQLGRNAIERVSELERGIAYRDQMIRQLNKEIDDLIKTDNETIRSLFAYQAKRDETIRQLRAQLDEYEQAPTVATQEPVAWAWNDSLGCMHVHCGSRRPHWVDDKCSDSMRAELSLRPLYAHPLALREPALSQAAAYIERLQSQKRQTQHGVESLRDHLREHAEREGQPYRFFYEMCGTLLKEMAESECRMDPRK